MTNMVLFSSTQVMSRVISNAAERERLRGPIEGVTPLTRLVALFALLGACGAEPQSSESECQGASIGMVECVETSDCGDRVAEWLDFMDGPETLHPGFSPQTLESSHCTQVTVIADDVYASGSACSCELDPGEGRLSVGPKGVGCFIFDRARHCLWDDSEFDGCVGEPDSFCEQQCERIVELRIQSRLELFDTELLAFECDRGSCKSVTRVDDQCFVDQRWLGPAPCDPDWLIVSGAEDPPAPVERPPSSPSCVR